MFRDPNSAGIYNSDGIDNLSGSVTLQGTIVADSTGPNCTGVISEGSGYNLDSGKTCNFRPAPTFPDESQGLA